ncbi:2Fe-2S iron-sulfur cluster-binding protein [Hansschlegelia plantiphila]|uniref:Oxidoreductase n=1 Tax=Hansschlegelia plantiphila TaxID=374655 RepID=A0A9W6J2X7_9HYPH|nr:2Fe-2S iron-sulfur cluster-binding protein [Hansschlegelia plantiphila]GLK69856.1 oxidoreductase [Hansschlegelia plantiphila]
MTYSVLVRQFDEPIAVKKGQTILDAALRAGEDYPFSCRSGACSSCKSQLFSGEVEHGSFDPAALSDEERASGLILACRAKPVSDCEVAFLEDDESLFSPATNPCSITSVERVTHDVAIVRAKPLGGQPLSFAAGQFASLTLPGFPSRDYSFANRPGSPELEFHVRVRAGGIVSRHIYETAAAGDRFSVYGPLGAAYLRKDHPGPITMVVGGTGLAPARSILLEALAALPGRPIALFFSAREDRDLYYTDEMTALAASRPHFEFHPIATRSQDAAEAPRTVFSLVAERFENLRGHTVYTCGSPSLVSACQAFAAGMGVTAADCHADPFVSAEQQQIAV